MYKYMQGIHSINNYIILYIIDIYNFLNIIIKIIY